MPNFASLTIQSPATAAHIADLLQSIGCRVEQHMLDEAIKLTVWPASPHPELLHTHCLMLWDLRKKYHLDLHIDGIVQTKAPQ